MIYNFFSVGLIAILFICLGSFLNVLSHRITFNKKFFTKRSMCPHCGDVIAWYDNIPVISCIILGGKCRICKGPISVLYPLIEILSGVLFTVLFLDMFTDGFYLKDSLSLTDAVGKFSSHLIFFSALICSTRSDLEAMIIPQVFTLWLVPVGFMFSYLGFNGINLKESLIGSIIGYGVLWLVAFIFKKVRKKDGLGVGDMELLALIGAFLGPLGIWSALMIGSISGLIIGGAYLLISKKESCAKIPFGPFLALGAIVHVFFERFIVGLIYSI